MFACGSKKKKNQMEALDPEIICKIHKANFEFICIKSDTEIPLQIKGCNLCKQEKKNDIFIPIKEISQRLIMQQYQDLIEKLCHSIKPFIDQIENLKNKLEEQINYFKQQLSRHIEDMVVTLLFKELHPKPFNTQDMYLLMSKLAVSNMSSIIEQQPILKTNEYATYITTKLIYNEKESQKISEILQDDYKFVTNRINDISQDLDNLFNSTYKQLQQIKSKNTKVVQMDEKDKALSFIIDVKKYSQGQHGQLLQQIQNIKQNKKIKKDKYESPDQVQVKCIVKLTDDQLAFSSNLPKIQFIKNEEIVHTLNLQDCEVTVLQKAFEDPHLLVGLEKNETEYTIDLYEIKTYTNLKTFIAHTGYIWNIINLPDYHIASCSDDSTIKIFNLQQWKEVQQLQVHQSAINDLALFNNDILVSVADDGMTVFQDFKKAELLGLHNEDAEVKCVSSLDGVSIVTGNNKGEIKIFGYTDQINLIKQIQLHKGLIRYICRVSPKIFVTSSWDGKHIFYSLQDEKIKEIDGPQVNMSEAMLWDQQKNCLISGQKGQLIIYQ